MTVEITGDPPLVRGRALTVSQQPLRYVEYAVTDEDTDLEVSIYSDPDLLTEISTPTTDANGVYQFYVSPGLYSIAFDTAERVDQPDQFRVHGLEDATGGAPTGPAGGVLGGTYPNPSFAADMATQAELNAHEADTTSIHGITNTANIVLTDDARLLPIVTENVQTASYTLVLGDAGLVVVLNVAGANTLTVPANASVAFPTGTVLEVFQLGAGQTTLTPDTGVTIRSSGGKLKLSAQYSSASLRKRATNEWVASGDLTT